MSRYLIHAPFRGSAFKDEIPAARKTISLCQSPVCRSFTQRRLFAQIQTESSLFIALERTEFKKPISGSQERSHGGAYPAGRWLVVTWFPDLYKPTRDAIGRVGRASRLVSDNRNSIKTSSKIRGKLRVSL
jgi:hypothetical protein